MRFKHEIVYRLGLISMILIMISSFSTAYDYEDSFRIHAGEEVKAGDYAFRVENAGFESSGLQLEVSEELEYSSHLLLQEQIVEFAGSEKLEYDLPDNGLSIYVNRIGWADGGTYINITVSSDENIFSSSDMDASIPENVVVSREEEISIPLTVTNEGTKNQSMSLGYNASEGISASFSYGGFNVTEVEIASGESETVSSKMEVLEGAPIGSHNITFYAHGLSNASDTVYFEVKGSVKRKQFSMDTDQNFIQTRPGEQIRVSPTVRNTGEAVLDDISVNIETPDGWTLDNRQMRTGYGLRPHDRERYYKRINVPANAEPGDYYIEIAPESEELEGETKQVRVNIRSKSGMSYVGVGLMVFSLLGMVITYRKLGRR